jgi:HEAT repeat protein
VSEADLEQFLAADSPAEAAALAQRIVADGNAAALADALVREVGSGESWRRHRALANLRGVDPALPLVPRLFDALRDEADAERRNAARSMLAVLAAPDALSSSTVLGPLEQLATSDPQSDVRVLAASAMGESGNCEARAALERALEDPDTNVVSAAADALGLLGDPRAVDALVATTERGEFWSRIAAVVALGRLRDRRAISALAAATADPLLAEAAATALGEIGDPAGLEPLRPLIEHAAPGARDAAERAAAGILSAHPSTPVPEWLRNAVRDRVDELTACLQRSDEDDCAVRLLGAAGTPRAARVLVDAFARPELRAAAAAGIAMLPHAIASAAILARVPAAPDEERAALLASLPALSSATADVVIGLLSASDAAARAAAADALGRSEPDAVLPALLAALETPARRLGAAEALARLSEPPAAPLASLLGDADARVRAAAADGLARAAAREHREAIAAALREEDDDQAKRALVRALGAAGGAEALDTLVPLLRAADAPLRFSVVRALGMTGAAEALPHLLDALADADAGIQVTALRALGELGDPRAAAPVAARLDAGHRDMRRTAASALHALAPAGVVDRLVAALDDGDWEIRLAAVRTLRRIGAQQAAEPLRRLAEGEMDPLVRREAEEALRDLDLTAARRAPGGV